MSWEYDLAKVIKSANRRENPLGLYLGTIVEEDPLVIRILDGEILIRGEELVQTAVFRSQMTELRLAGLSPVGRQAAVLGRQWFLAISLV